MGASATWDRQLTSLWLFWPRPSSTSGRCCRWDLRATETRRMRAHRPLRAIRISLALSSCRIGAGLRESGLAGWQDAAGASISTRWKSASFPCSTKRRETFSIAGRGRRSLPGSGRSSRSFAGLRRAGLTIMLCMPSCAASSKPAHGRPGRSPCAVASQRQC